MYIAKRSNFYLIYVTLVVLLCFIFFGCAKQPSEKIALKINNYSINATEFNELFSELELSSDTPEIRENFLENLINRKLILQEAQKEGLDRRGDFLKAIENFWEQSLLTIIIDKKVKEISGDITVSEEEIGDYYNEWIKANPSEQRTLDEMKPSIRWHILRYKQASLLNSWIKTLRDDADIKIDKNALRIEE